jgi:hypothetical protein
MRILTPAERLDLAAKARAIEDRVRVNLGTPIFVIVWTMITFMEKSSGMRLVDASLVLLYMAFIVVHFLSGRKYVYYLIPTVLICAAILLIVTSGLHLRVYSIVGAAYLIWGLFSLRDAVICSRANDGTFDSEQIKIESWCQRLQAFLSMGNNPVERGYAAVDPFVQVSTGSFLASEVWFDRDGGLLFIASRFSGKIWSLRVFDATTVKVEENIEKRQLRIGDLKLRNVDFTPQLKDSLTQALAH